MITVKKIDSVACIEIEGRLDTLTSAEFDKSINPLLEKEQFMVLDFAKCIYLSSFGIRSLINASKKLHAKDDGKLILCNLSAEVFQVLEMAGLDKIFTFSESVEKAVQMLGILKKKPLVVTELAIEGCQVRHYPTGEPPQIARIWHDQGIAGYDELGIAFGIGISAEMMNEKDNTEDFFITTGNCAAFFPPDQSQPTDFRVTHQPARTGIFVKEAISFRPDASAVVQVACAGSFTFRKLDRIIREVINNYYEQTQAYVAVIANRHPEALSVSLFLSQEQVESEILTNKLETLHHQGKRAENSSSFSNAKFILSQLKEQDSIQPLKKFLNKNLAFENIIDIGVLNEDDVLTNPLIWLITADKNEDASEKRIRIVAEDAFLSEPYKPFLTRRLYQDSSRVELQPLHGGFSAQTYQVTSFDPEGRKLRPTVLKMANRALITREAERCSQYAMPYILNNSAMVLGSEFFGNNGALRYNFVGIGGEQTRLKWLTHYYQNWPVEQLEPLFDKIFLQILSPWYGQPVLKTIHPFSDHDPTKTFFPHIFDTAAKELKISADEPELILEENGQKLMNPYWFLKHEYPKKRDIAMAYQTSICHGDLNMQNILLDDDMNVYLIDFSETRPRSVVSDFARLEAIFMIEFTPSETGDDFIQMVDILNSIYGNPASDSDLLTCL